MNQTHASFNARAFDSCTLACEPTKRTENEARTETELHALGLLTKVREAERKAGGLKGPAKVEAMREADRAAAELYRVIREVKP